MTQEASVEIVLCHGNHTVSLRKWLAEKDCVLCTVCNYCFLPVCLVYDFCHGFSACIVYLEEGQSVTIYYLCEFLVNMYFLSFEGSELDGK